MVKSCPKTISVLNDPKSQFMTPNLGSWFVLHHGGVSVEPSCFLCGKGLNPSQGLQPLVTGSSSAATSAPSNRKHQVPWPSFSFHICLKARRSWARHTGPCVAGSKDPAWAPAARVRGTIRCGWACEWPHRTHGRRRGTAWWGGLGKRGGQAARWPKTGWCLSFGLWCLKALFAPLDVVLSGASVALHGDCQAETS